MPLPELPTLDTSDIQDRPAKPEKPERSPSVQRRQEDQDFAVCPFQIQIDTREQFPWSFRGIGTDRTKDKPSRPLIVPTQVATLQTADYSIQGFEDQIVIERKSLPDLYGTLGGGRERFVKELERMAVIANHPAGGFAAVIVEASWQAILFNPPEEAKRMTPKSVYRSVLAWQQRAPFNRIHWLMMDSRELAERIAFRCLERFWLDEQERVNPPKRSKQGAIKP